MRAQHLIAGSVAKVGDKLALNLVLIDTAQGIALKRHTEETTDPSALMDTARRALIVLLQPVLNAIESWPTIDLFEH